MCESIEDIQKELKKVLKRKRYQHTLGVRYIAQSLAMSFGGDIEAAGYAGVLHDCAKCFSDKEMLEECKKYHIPCNKAEKNQPSLLHAKLGAYYAKEKYGIKDEQILSAIRWHTTGKPDMTDFEKMIFIADYIEPGRKELPGMSEIRKMAFHDLNQTVYLILDHTLSYLQEKQGDMDFIDANSVDAYYFYKKIVKA